MKFIDCPFKKLKMKIEFHEIIEDWVFVKPLYRASGFQNAGKIVV